jgi:hypothetical protein
MTTSLRATNVQFTNWIYPPPNFNKAFEEGTGSACLFTAADGLFQDAAATTPVTAADQIIAYATDQSGSGHPLLNGTAGVRPTWYYHTEFAKHGARTTTNQRLQSAESNFFAGGTGLTMIVAAYRASSGSANGPLLRLQAGVATSYRSYVSLEGSGVKVRRLTGETEVATGSLLANSERAVISARVDFAGGTLNVRKNAATFADMALTTPGAVDLSSSVLSLFADRGATLFFNGIIYEYLIVDRVLDDETLMDYEDKMALDAAIVF